MFSDRSGSHQGPGGNCPDCRPGERGYWREVATMNPSGGSGCDAAENFWTTTVFYCGDTAHPFGRGNCQTGGGGCQYPVGGAEWMHEGSTEYLNHCTHAS